jgi:signal transduction histidine kinase
MSTARSAHDSHLLHNRDVQPNEATFSDVDALFEFLRGALADALHADSFFLALYDELSRTVEVVRQLEFDTELPGGTFPLGQGITSEVIRTRRARLVRRWSQEAPRVQVQYLSKTPGLPESALTVPLVAGDEVLGVIAIHKYAPDAFDEHDLLQAERIAASAAATIARLRSEHAWTRLQTRVSELQSILSTMADAVLIVDYDGRLIALNHAARELLCVQEVSLVLGQPLVRRAWGSWPLGAPELAETLGPLLARVKEGKPLAEAQARLESQGDRVLSFTATPLLDRHRDVTGAVLVVRDIGHNRGAEGAARDVLAVASHELRTPVTVIRTQAELLRRMIRAGTVTSDQIDADLVSIVNQTQRLATMLSLLLDVSGIEEGRVHLARRHVDLAALTAAAISDVQATTERHTLGLHVSGKPTGYWDDRRLQQVLANLITNAVKYSPEGGPVDVFIDAHPDVVTVRVKDRGIGLACGQAKHVFDRFYRARSARRLEGSGLGLHICKSLIVAHGGRIWVESEGAGQGSVFSFILPRRPIDTHVRRDCSVPGDIIDAQKDRCGENQQSK